MFSRRRSFAGLVAFLALVWGGCSSHKDPWEGKGGPPRVVVTFPPLVSFVKSVGGDHVGVISLCTHTGPHDYQYNVEEIIALREADLFLANGLGLDDNFADKLHLNVNIAKLPYIKLGNKLPASLKHKDNEEPEAKGKEAHKHEHDHGEYDPHVWLGIPQAKKMVEQIRDELKKIDPAHAKDYDRNTTEYLAELDGLEKEGKAMLKGKKIKLVSFHDSLDYFADTYGLDVVAVLEPLGEKPDMVKVVEACKKNKVEYIAVEPQYPAASADTLKRELAKEKLEVKMVTIDPLETADPKELGAGWYIEKVKENLKQLAGSEKSEK